MVKVIMIVRVIDGLILVEGFDDGRDVFEVDYYK